jgi:hypothetical protein
VTQTRLRGLLEKWGVTVAIAPDMEAASALAATLAPPPVLLVVDHGATEDAAQAGLLDALSSAPGSRWSPSARTYPCRRRWAGPLPP